MAWESSGSAAVASFGRMAACVGNNGLGQSGLGAQPRLGGGTGDRHGELGPIHRPDEEELLFEGVAESWAFLAGVGGRSERTASTTRAAGPAPGGSDGRTAARSAAMKDRRLSSASGPWSRVKTCSN